MPMRAPSTERMTSSFGRWIASGTPNRRAARWGSTVMGILVEGGLAAGQEDVWLPVASGTLALRLGSALPPSFDV